ncbi:MAG: glycosyltransferase [Candidatus Aenigmarchaeota archaeon]|nr:glycosyltransferase [Candidatus Aenigmarchaeota archaeon]
MKKRIFGVHESDYVNEWLGPLEGKVTVMLFRKGKRMSIKSYTSYSDAHVRKIIIPFPLRGRKITEVGPADHLVYTFTLFLLLPLLLLQDLIIFMTPTFFTALTMPFLKLFGKKVYVVCVDPQTALYHTYQKRKSPLIGLYWMFSRYLEIMAVRTADSVFVVSEHLKKEYSRYNENVFLAMNGADLASIEKIKPKRMWKEFTIAYFGSFDPWRGVDMLVKAFKKVEKKRKSRLLLLGGGSQEASIRGLAGNDKNIHITGYINHDKAIEYLKGSDLTVVPFRDDPILKETLSIKPFEYMACGNPILITNTGQHADVVKSFGSGILVEPNEHDMADAIVKIIDDKKLYKKLKENSMKARKEVDFRKTRQAFYKKVSV